MPLPPPKKGTVSEKTRKSAESAYEKGQAHEPVSPVSRKRSQAREKALKREPRTAASHAALSRQAKSAAKKRSVSQRSAVARKAAATKKTVKSKRQT